MIRRSAFLAVALAAVVLAAVGCSGTNAVSQSVGGSLGYGTGDQATTWIGPGDRKEVTGVRGSLVDGTAFDLSQWTGHVIVVNFWGSWCGPCKGEARSLEQVYRDNQSQGVEFVGIDIRDNRPAAESFVQRYEVTYPTLFDESNLLALRFHGMPPNATPTTIVLDRQGRIAARHSGAILYTELRRLVARVLKEPSR